MTLEQQLIQEFGTSSFSDRTPVGKGLGRAARKDDRDYELEGRFSVERTSGKQLWANPIQLNQGSEGACVGFGWTGFMNSEPVIHEYQNKMGFEVYKRAQQLDEWAGTNYSGTSVRAGAKVLVERGHIKAYAFTGSTETLALHLLNRGPVVIGVDWHTGMDRVDSQGFIYPTGQVRGGHCVVVDGVIWKTAGEVDRFRIRNSWGLSWGLNGRARIRGVDMQYLLNNDGDACVAVEVV